jgi:hypothetical protein
MANKLEAARALAAQGFKIFPIRPNAKAPPLWKDWPSKATSKLPEAWPEDANIGISTEGMVVIDVDVKKGGRESLHTLQMLHSPPDTLTSVTPTGGLHLFFRGETKNGVDVLGPGLDIRSNGGYVVAPGSTIDGREYTFEDTNVTVAEAPDWLIQKVGAFTKREQVEHSAVKDAPPTVYGRAFDWLKTAPRSVKGAGGDQTAYVVACYLRDLGVSELQACELMRSEAWDYGCGWRAGRLEEKPIHSAYAYGQNEAGAKAALPSEFPPVVLEAKVVPRSSVMRLSDFASSSAKPSPYLVKGLLRQNSYAEIYGEPGAGKTFVALDIAHAVSAGKEWMGRKVKQGAVLYLAYEGIGGLVKRAQALRQAHGDADVPLYIADAAMNLREKAGREALGALMADLPEKPICIIIDTFARALMGADENSAQDVGLFNAAIKELISATSACVIIIHHSGKNKNAGARGSSSLLGAVDSVLQVDTGKIVAEKQRDDEMGDPIGFKLVTVQVGFDEDNDPVVSCVVEPAEVGATAAQGTLKGATKDGLAALCDLSPTNEPVALAAWYDACREGFLGEGDTAKEREAIRTKLFRMKRALTNSGHVVIDKQKMVTRRCE